MSFLARKAADGSFVLYRADCPFATIRRIPPHGWAIATDDSELERKFKATPFTDDVTPRGVCLAVRAMVELTEANTAFEVPPWRRGKEKRSTAALPSGGVPVLDGQLARV